MFDMAAPIDFCDHATDIDVSIPAFSTRMVHG